MKNDTWGVYTVTFTHVGKEDIERLRGLLSIPESHKALLMSFRKGTLTGQVRTIHHGDAQEQSWQQMLTTQAQAISGVIETAFAWWTDPNGNTVLEDEEVANAA